MKQDRILEKVRKQLRVREQLPARALAARAELSTPQVAKALHDLVRDGLAVRHPGSTRRGDRAARYSKPSNARVR